MKNTCRNILLLVLRYIADALAQDFTTHGYFIYFRCNILIYSKQQLMLASNWSRLNTIS